MLRTGFSDTHLPRETMKFKKHAAARSFFVGYLTRPGDLILLSITVFVDIISDRECPPLFQESH